MTKRDIDSVISEVIRAYLDNQIDYDAGRRALMDAGMEDEDAISVMNGEI